MHSDIPVSFAEAKRMTARELWQAETMIWAIERIQRRAKLEGALNAAHDAAVRKRGW